MVKVKFMASETRRLWGLLWIYAASKENVEATREESLEI